MGVPSFPSVFESELLALLARKNADHDGKGEHSMSRLREFRIGRLCGLVVTLIISLPLPWAAQELSFDEKWDGFCGVIENPVTKTKMASGFVAGNPRQVITCAHVVIDAKTEKLRYNPAWFVPKSSPTSFGITLKYMLPRYDIAVLQTDKPILQVPLDFGDITPIRPGSMVFYMGWKAGTNLMVCSATTVTATGSALHQGAVVDFLEFEGEGRPGYSGGPVFVPPDNRVVAIMTEAWTKRGVKGGKEILVNRAFSLEPLAICEREVFRAEKRSGGSPSKSSISVLDIVKPDRTLGLGMPKR